MLIKAGSNLAKIVKNLGIEGEVIEEEELKKHTTIRIGGPAEVFVKPFSLLDLEKIIVFTSRNKIPCFILGGGSKVLFPDEMLKGVVLKLNSAFLKKISSYKEVIKVGSGVKVNELLEWMLVNSYGEWEFLAGIPCSLGGAVYLNAGVREAPGKGKYIQIGDFVKEVTVMDKWGNVATLDRKKLKFNYRESNLTDFIILEISLMKKRKKNSQSIRNRIERFLNYRRKTQELRFPTAGCVFKNPLNIRRSSGELIELSGMKGSRIGDVMVSEKHANFFINLGKATAKDFLLLMENVQRKVKSVHGVWLEPEIKVIRNY
ncbi:MAG: UDP-N-acetylmuramate dehydrogenase [Candidatus Omnitrophota bacterium]